MSIKLVESVFLVLFFDLCIQETKPFQNFLNLLVCMDTEAFFLFQLLWFTSVSSKMFYLTLCQLNYLAFVCLFVFCFFFLYYLNNLPLFSVRSPNSEKK